MLFANFWVDAKEKAFIFVLFIVFYHYYYYYFLKIFVIKMEHELIWFFCVFFFDVVQILFAFLGILLRLEDLWFLELVKRNTLFSFSFLGR